MRQALARLTTIKTHDEDVQRRGQVLVILTLLLEVAALVGIIFTILNSNSLITIGLELAAMAIFGMVLLVAHRGHVTAGSIILIGTIALLLLLTTINNGSPTSTPFFLVIALLVGSLVLPPKYIWVVSFLLIGSLLGVMYRVFPELMADAEIQSGVFSVIFLLVIVSALGFLGALVTQNAFTIARVAREKAEQAAEQLSITNAQLDQRVNERTQELESALREVELRSEQQEQLLAENESQRILLRELSVPVLPVSSSTLVMPLIGALDSQRLQDLQQQALGAIERTGARQLLLDITGVPVVDTLVAQGLIQVVEMARLLGAQVVLVGVRPEVAQAVVGLGINLNMMRSFTDLQSALAHA